MARLHLETLNVFQLRGFAPSTLHHLYGTNCILATNDNGKFSCLDIVSGDELSVKDVPHRGSGAVLTVVHPRTTKLVVVNEGVMGARGMVEGGILLDTILQPPASDNSSLVTLEIPVVQVPKLVKELQTQRLSVDSELLSSVLDQLEAKLADGGGTHHKGSLKWSTISFEGPVLKLYELFEEIFVKMKGSSQASAEPGSEPQTSVYVGSPALPIISAIRLRLLLLKPDEKLHRLELGGSLDPDDVKLMYSEAMRRLSLQKWPHKDYVWAVPKTMAAAGFCHLPNIPPNAAHSHSQGDRTSCFLCHIYLYGWEKTDEPWSEHERHSPLCPFVHGESTENVPVAVTEGTHPAVVCVVEEEDCATCISTVSNTDLVAVGTKLGHISVWDINRVLFIMECTSLDISVQLLDACLSSVTSSCQRQADSDPSNCMMPNKDSVPLAKAPFSRAQSFSITSLCLVGSPSSTLLLSHAATEGQSVLLVAGLTVCLGDSTLPLLLLHCFKQQLAGLKQQEATSTQYGSAPSYIPVLSSSSSDQHPAEGNLHSTYSGSPSQSMFDLTCMYLPPSSLAGIENVLDDREEEEEEVPLPGAGGGVAVPQCPEAAQMLSVVPLIHFTSALDESPPEVQSLVPLGGGHLLVVHVRCAKSTGEYPYGGLHVYPVTASDGGQVVLGATPTSTLKFTRESEAVSLCAALGMDDQSQAPCDLIATVTRDGSVVVYGTDLVKVAERPPAHEDPYTRVCARVEQLVVVRQSGQTEVMRLVLPPVAGEAMTAEAPIGDGSTVLPTPEQLETFVQLTKCSSRSLPFYACAPMGWLEIPLLQYMRKSLAHVVYESTGGGQEELPHTRIWKYQHGANEKDTSGRLRSRHFFELTVDHLSSHIGCVSVQFNFADPQSISGNGTVTLLRPSQSHPHRNGSPLDHTPLRSPDSECVCGPVRVKQFLDITNHSVRINFCHPDLLRGQVTTLWLLVEDLFSDDWKYGGRPSSAAAAARPASPSSSPGSRLISALRQRNKAAQTKSFSSTEQGILLVSLYPPKGSSPMSSQLGLFIQLMESQQFLSHLVLVACSHRVQRAEYKKLPRPLQARVDSIEEKDPLLSKENQLRALELLCWAASLHSWRRGSKPVQDAVLPLAVSLLHSCYIAGGRELAHKCSRLIVALCRDIGDGGVHDNPRPAFLRSLCALLPFLLQCRSAACVHWLLRMLSSLCVGQQESHATMVLCLKSLVDMTTALQEKSSLNTQLLHTYFQQDGYVFEPELFDVYLSYSQKGTSKSAQKSTTATEQHTQLLSSSHTNIPTSSPVPTLVDKRNHTIYDAELELLLEPLPAGNHGNQGTQAGGRRSTLLKDPMGIFKHGSFLLYGQRGLLETHPLEYTCLTISGSAMVEEGHQHPSGASSSSSSIPLQPQLPEPHSAVGYHFPASAARKRESPEATPPSVAPVGVGGDGASTTKQVPPLLLTPLILPKELVMSIESLKSGVSYSAVLKFAHPVALTDFSIPSTEFMSSVTVDVWLEEEAEGDAVVRVAHSSEIIDKSLMVGNLMPPPLCQYVKVSFVGKLGASREKVQVFLGAFYGHPAIPGGEALSPVTLKSLESKMLSEYYRAKDKLVSSLALYTSVVNKSSDAAQVKQHEDLVAASNQACFKLQVRLARLRNFLRHYRASSGCAWGGGERVFELKDEAGRALLVDVASSQLCKTIGCLVDTLLVLSLNATPAVAAARGKGLTDDVPAAVSSPPPPPSYLSEEDCSLLFMTLCVQGIPKLHARSCALLVTLCGSQPWWGSFVTGAVTSLYSMSQTTVFHKERALLQLSALCQRTCTSSNVMQCLLDLLHSKLSCLLGANGTYGGSRQLDQQLVQWLLLLLSHSLSSLTPSHHGNLFSPSLESLPSRPPQQSSQAQLEVKASAVTTALSKGDWRSILRDLNELKREMRGGSTVPRLLDVLVAEDAVPAMKPPLQTSTPMSPLVLPFSVSPDMCASMTKGLVEFIILLIESRSCHFVPVACKALTHVLRLSDTVPLLSSVVTQRQLDQLLFFLCQKSQLLTGAQDQGSLKWCICAVEWLVVSLVCQGIGSSQQQPQQQETLLSTIRRASGGTEDMQLLHPAGVLQGSDERRAEAKPKSYAEAMGKAGEPGEGAKLLTSMAKVMKKAEAHCAELLQETDEDAQRYIELLAAISSEATDEEVTAVGGGVVPVQADEQLKQEQEASSKDEGVTTDTSDTAVKSDEELQVVPEWKPKQKKKLSRQHSTSAMKYAPGDYTEVPSFSAPPGSSSVPDFDQLPYSLYIISGTVDSRLLTSLELTAELELQCTARRVYESILWALALARPLTSSPEDSMPQCTRAAARGCPDPAHSVEATGMLLRAVESTLERARTSHCKLDIVPLLELWVWLNSLDWHPDFEVQRSSAARRGVAGHAESNLQSNGKTALGVFSDRTLGLLMDLVLATANLNLDSRLCHLIIALFHSVLKHLKSMAGGSSSFDFVVDVEKFSDVVARLCSDWPECSASEGPVLVTFFTDLLCVRVVDCCGRKEPQYGILLLLDILSVIMEDSENVAIHSSALFKLVEVLGNQNHLKLLWNTENQSCHHRTLSALCRLCTSVVDLLSSSVTLTNQSNVTLHVAELDEDRRKYRYLSVSHASQELRWIQVPLQTNTGSKLISELLHLLRETLSAPVPESVTACLRDFSRKEFPTEDATAVDPVRVADEATPLLTLIYSNAAQLTSLLYLLNSTDGPLRVAGETSAAPSTSSSVQGLFLNFVHFLQAHCADPTCFFKPILEILSSLHSLQSDATISKPFVSFVGKLMADTQRQGTSRQLLGFIEQGGAKCVFDCFVSTCRQSPERPLDHSISSLGSRETTKPFKEGSKLIDILPLASVKLSPCRTNIRDLQNCSHGNYPSRSSAFHHVFNSGEEWLKMDISLHFPVLLHTVQLFQTMGAQFSGPSVVQISCGSRPGSSPVLPVTPLVDTTRFPCIRLELLQPAVAQHVVIMMKKPMVSNIISLSHMHVLALEYGSSADGAKKSVVEVSEDTVHPCSGWLSIVDHWVSQGGEMAERVLNVAGHHPELLSSCFSLLQNVNSLDFKTVSQLRECVLAMVRRFPDLGLTAVQHLLGFPSLASIGPNEPLPSQSTPSLVVNSMSTSLLHELFQMRDEHVIPRLLVSLKLLNSLLSPAHKEFTSQLPPLVRVLAGAVWHNLSQSTSVDTELFSSFADAALSLDLNSSLRSSLGSLLCAMCRHSPHLFSLVISRCQAAIAEDTPNTPSLLHLLAHVAKSDDCIRDLLTSKLAQDLISWLRATFTALRDKAHASDAGVQEDDVRASLSKASAYLAFFTDLSQNCNPVQEWLGSAENVQFWYPMMEFLSLEPPFVPTFDISFCHDVALSFFGACLLSRQNKVLFARLLCNILRGAYSGKEPDSEGRRLRTGGLAGGEGGERTGGLAGGGGGERAGGLAGGEGGERTEGLAGGEGGVKAEGLADGGGGERTGGLANGGVSTGGHADVPLLTTFMYKLIVNLVLKEESVTVVLQLDSHLPSPCQSLTKTTDTQEFHPSFPIGEHSYCIQLQSSCSLQQLEGMCVKSGDTAPPSSGAKRAPSELPQAWQVWEHNLRKFDLSCWKTGAQNSSAVPETKDNTKSKQLSLLFTTLQNGSTRTFLSPSTVIGQLMTSGATTLAGQLLLIAVVDSGQHRDTGVCSAQVTDAARNPSLLDLFIQCGGLEVLAGCLPALYSYNWPEPVASEGERPQLAAGHFKPHVLLHLMPHILFHSVLMLGLCLKIVHFCRALRDNLPVATVLLRMLLGAELTGSLAKTVQQEFSFLPYLVFHKVLVMSPASTEPGCSLRCSALAAGVIHHTLFCLSVSGHHTPRVPEKDVTTREFAVVSALETSCTTTRVTVSTDKHYWAKGTGFSTGSTASKWNMDATLARQRSGEKFVYLCFAILAEFVGTSEGPAAHCTQELCDILTTSCLLPAAASYLLNDSVLDISKHIPLYNSVLELLFCLASNESLRHLLMLPVFSEATVVSSDGSCLSSLLAKLGTLAKTYQKTAGTDTTAAMATTEGSSQPSASSGSESDASFLRLLQTMSNSSSSADPPGGSEESGLNELVSKIIVTDSKVAGVVRAMQAEQVSPPQRPGDEQTVDNSFSSYMKLIKPLQFRMYQMTDEDDNGRIRFKVPFFFDSRVQSSVSSSSSSSVAATRARRLAQEVATLSTSLPLSPSSSVFVCCDEERLDVMKVLITGPSETPYANGCFEFDVYFPPDYPRVPMLVNLMTTGQGRVRFNPNLYNDGKVCLSVLNTWHGSPEEKWNAQTSSFLQVLVSIQSLILVPEPFFNEPGYEQYRGTGYGNLKSLAYNANICTATVQWAMLSQLRNPSPCFREVILQHFYLRQAEVLAQCEQWKNAIMKGIQMQTSGFELKEHLQNLTSSVDTLRTELSKLCPSDAET